MKRQRAGGAGDAAGGSPQRPREAAEAAEAGGVAVLALPPSAATFAAQHVQPSVPVLVRGALADWPAMQRWQDVRYFAESAPARLRDSQIGVAAAADAVYSGDPKRQDSIMMKWSSFVELVDMWDRRGSGEGHFTHGLGLHFYLAQTPISSGGAEAGDAEPLLEHLRRDIATPPFAEGLPGFRLFQCNLWMGTSASSSAVHFDSNHNLLCCIKGAKTVLLYPPDDTAHLAPEPVFTAAYHHAGMRTGSDAPRGGMRRAVVRSGEALFIPEGWWHSVESSPATIAVNIWWEGLRAAVVDNECEGVAGVGVYLGRLCLQRQVQSTKERWLREAAAAEDAASWPQESDAAAEWLRASTTTTEQALAFLRAAPLPLQVGAVGAVAELDAPRWRSLFGSIDALTAFSLTTAWESGALDEEEQKNYFSRIGTPLETGWERRLIELNESFGKRAMAHVLDIFYGFRAAAP